MNPKSLERWQFLFAASWLLWMVIFNHMAESATYVIAIGGAMLAFSQFKSMNNADFEPVKNTQLDDDRYNSPWILAFIMMFLFTMLGPTDIYPKEVRFWIVETAQLKAFPCILLWGLALIKMLKTVRN
jgi:hypothetical protein